jgi:hypothetical protein
MLHLDLTAMMLAEVGLRVHLPLDFRHLVARSFETIDDALGFRRVAHETRPPIDHYRTFMFRGAAIRGRENWPVFTFE